MVEVLYTLVAAFIVSWTFLYIIKNFSAQLLEMHTLVLPNVKNSIILIFFWGRITPKEIYHIYDRFPFYVWEEFLFFSTRHTFRQYDLLRPL